MRDEAVQPIILTAEQRQNVEKALAKAKDFAPGEQDEGRLIEIICIDFLESFAAEEEEPVA